MSKQRLHRLERKQQGRDSFTEYPIFVFTEAGGYIIGDYILSRMGVNPSNYQQSKTEEAKTRHEQAAANVQDTKVRSEKAAQNQAERDKRLKDKSNSNRQPLPAPP